MAVGISVMPELNYCDEPVALDYMDIFASQDILYQTISSNATGHGQETTSFFYHGDHLGSANWITDKNGVPVQYLHYLPYGQLLANQQVSGSTYDERYKFTGKERDEESGYDYFGARYYIPPLLHWSSVDPLADKYPGISPYAYCLWNPIKHKDPNGKLVETAWDIANVAIDIASLKSNVSNGNIMGAVVDGIGLAIDAAAVALPLVPAGAGTAIKVYRAADKVGDAG